MVCMDVFIWRINCRSVAIFIFMIIFILSTKGAVQDVEGRAVLHERRAGIFGIGSEKIGSTPPRCEGKCSWCGHCEAIQVPANLHMKDGNANSSTAVHTNINTIPLSRVDADSNYKPLSWKCKCGKFIFDP